MTLEAAIASRARAAGLDLPEAATHRLAAHARLVLASNDALHLTTITESEAFVERHLGEAFAGAVLLDDAVRGTLLDLGSGNGYPGIPIAVARPGLRAVLAESSRKKAEFLRRALVAAELADGEVLEASVRRAADLEALAPVDVVVTRAAGGWEAILPRLAGAMRKGGIVLVWAGRDAEAIVTRASWKRFRLERSLALPGRSVARLYQLHRI